MSGAVGRRLPRRFGEVLVSLHEVARRSDAMVVAAALTCYATFGLIPLLAVATRFAAWCFGTDAVVDTATDLAGFLPGPLHLDDEMVTFARDAAGAPWWTSALALVPISLYAEGTVRGLERFSRAPERRSRILRGRALTPVFLLFAILAAVLTVGVLRPVLSDPFGRGLGARLLGIFVAFDLLFGSVFCALLVIYRLFASTRVRRGPLALAAFAAGSWIAGQTLGYVLALRAVSGFDNAFGRYAPAGEVAALLFLAYLQHLVFVVGYQLALVLHERPDAASGRSDLGGDDLRRQRHEGQPAARVGRTADQEQPAGP